MNRSIECYTYTRCQTVLVSNGEWKTESCQKKRFEPLSHSSQNHLFSFSAGMNLPQNVLQSSPIGQQNAKKLRSISDSSGLQLWMENWIMSKTMTANHILARTVFSFSGRMNPHGILVHSSRIGHPNAKITLDITQFWSRMVSGKLNDFQILTPCHILARIIF
jgi:hypothetical protein